MKKQIQVMSGRAALALIIFLFISSVSSAQQTEIKPDAPVVIETVILKFPDINSAKSYTAVQTALVGTEGVSIRGRCPNADYLFINIDRRYFPNNDDVLQKISDANFVFEVVSDKSDEKPSGICSEIDIAK